MSELTETESAAGPVWDVVVLGGGPAGLAAAEAAASAGARVLVAEKMPTLGRKFLMAGKSGLNITNTAAPDAFRAAYPLGGDRLAPMLDAIPPDRLRAWCAALGQETFEGSGGRVFPRVMKASPLLRAWRRRLESAQVEIRTRWRWTGLDPAATDLRLRFETPEGATTRTARAVVVALGGASWARLGSDGAWTEALQRYGPLRPFAPSNAGVEIAWSEHFRARFAGAPLKDVRLSLAPGPDGAPGPAIRGECAVTAHGLEGTPIYALSAELRDRLAAGPTTLRVDLAPGRAEPVLAAALARRPPKISTANWLRKAARLTGAKAALAREPGPLPTEPAALAARLKACPLPLTGVRPLDEAISTAGGLDWAGLDESLMLRARPGLFAAGEMIDWDAPTGGYLLTACIATGRWAGAAAARWAKTRANAGPTA